MGIDIRLNGATINVGNEEEFIINENNVDGELCSVGKFLSFYGNLAVDLKTQLAAARLDLETFEATLAQDIRRQSLITKAKITEGGIQEQLLINKDRNDIARKIIELERDYLKVENLFRSQQKRADCVIALAYKQRTEIAKSSY